MRRVTPRRVLRIGITSLTGRGRGTRQGVERGTQRRGATGRDHHRRRSRTTCDRRGRRAPKASPAAARRTRPRKDGGNGERPNGERPNNGPPGDERPNSGRRNGRSGRRFDAASATPAAAPRAWWSGRSRSVRRTDAGSSHLRSDRRGSRTANGTTAPPEPSRAIATRGQASPPAVEAPPPSLSAPAEKPKLTKPARRRKPARGVAAELEGAASAIALPAPDEKSTRRPRKKAAIAAPEPEAVVVAKPKRSRGSAPAADGKVKKSHD